MFSMDPPFTPEHQMFRRTLRDYVEKELAPHALEWDEAGIFPREVFRGLAEIGALGINYPESVGGAGGDYWYVVVLAEELVGTRNSGVNMGVLVQSQMATPIIQEIGTDEQKKEFLIPALAGEKIGALGISEPDAGSDVANLRTTARRVGDDYVINGAKMWITNSLQADWMCLLANTSEGVAHKNKSLIMVPMTTPGVTKAKKIRKIGMMSSDTGLIHFDDVRVPQTNRIGEEGLGFTYQMMQFQEERLWAAAHAIQALLNTIQQTADFARERQIFGMSVLDHQVCHYKLAELKTEVESLRGLVYMATEKYVAGADVTEWASMAKLKACRLGRLVPDACMQHWGGMGYTWENRVSRLYRDGRLASIGGGADEVMLGIIGKYMHVLPGKR